MNVWFVPSNSRHLGKFRVLLDAMIERGVQVQVLCVDSALRKRDACLHQIEAAGYDHVVLPANDFNPDNHLFWHWFQVEPLYKAVQKALTGHEIDVLLVGGDTGVSGRTVVQAARGLGIPTTLLVDGIVLPPNRRYWPGLVNGLRDRFRVLLRSLMHVCGVRGKAGTDLVLLMNATGRDVLAADGVRPWRLRVVGSTEYDRLAADIREGKANIDERELRARLGIPGDKPVVFFAHHPIGLDDAGRRLLVRQVVAGGRRAEACVLVKFHPRSPEDPDAWRRWADAEGMGADDVVFAKSECTSIEAIMLCSALVTMYSTVVLEAMVAGRPLVLVQYLSTRYVLNYGSRYGAALDAKSPEGLQEAIFRAVRDEETRERLLRNAEKVLEREMFGMDGRSVERAIAEITALADRGIHGRPPRQQTPAR